MSMGDENKWLESKLGVYRTPNPISFTIMRSIIRIPNNFDIQCECGKTLVKAFSIETGILDCSCGCSYSVQPHKK